MSDERFDTLIVGAGSAGCVLAARLSEDKSRSVLLLEAGPDHRQAELPDELRRIGRPIGWPYEWGEHLQSLDGRKLDYLRGRGVGGSSATNGAVAMRAEPPDFESWPRGWRYDDFLPAFKRMENDADFGASEWHGNAGPVPIVRWAASDWAPTQRAFYEACIAEGFADCPDHNAPATSGVGPIPMNRSGNERVSAARSYLEPARVRPNLRVRGDAHVARIRFDGTRATGVELVSGGHIAAGEVILCAGVLQSPLLLLRSGIGPRAALDAIGCEPRAALPELPAVGAHWSDHFALSFSTPIDPALCPRGAPGLQTILRATADGSAYPHDLQLTPWILGGKGGGRELVISVSLQQPIGCASVTASAADPLRPAIDWGWVAEPENLRRAGEGLRLAARIVARAGVALEPAALASWQERSDRELSETVVREYKAFYHGVGSCRMGDSGPEHCVVDPDCRVHGTQGLRIVDAAIAPRVPRSNTNILVMATAEMAAERLR